MADAIYYPMLRFRDVGWLKTSALYWESIGRIVPPTIYEDLLDGDAAKLREEGVVCDLPAEGEAMYQVGSAFQHLLNPKDPGNRINDLRQRYGLDKGRADNTNRSPSPSYSFGRDYDPKLGYLLSSRLTSMLQDDLRNAGLAENMATEGWLGVHPALADITMRALAVAMAGSCGRRPLTDSLSEHATMPFALDSLEAALLPPETFMTKASQQQRSGDERYLLEIALQTIQLADPAEIPVKLILEVREKWGRELRQSLVNSVEAIVAELLQIKSEHERALRIKRWESEIRASVDRLHDELNRAKLKTRLATVSATFNLLTGAAAGVALIPFLGPAAPILTLAVTGAITFGQVRLDADEKRDEIIQGSRVGWLIALEQDLSPEEITRRALEPVHQRQHY